MNIVFIARSLYYRNMYTTVSYDFINSIVNSKQNNIKLFWDDENLEYIKNEINRIKPKIIIVFDINNFFMQQFNFIFNMNIPIYLFLEDTYYITSNTSHCHYTNKVDGIIFWYVNHNVYTSYKNHYPNKLITHLNSRYVNTEIYKDYKLEKKYDILLYGTRNVTQPYKIENLDSIQKYIKKYESHYNIEISSGTKINFYPLRAKLESILNKLKDKYNILIIPETSILDNKINNIANENLSRLINESYLTVACPGIADVLMHKFLEISASKSVILGTYPSDYKDLFDGNIINVTEFMDDNEIINIIDNALANKQKLLEISDILYKKVHSEHNLIEASKNFDYNIDLIIKK